MDKKQTLEESAEIYAIQNASGFFIEPKKKAFIDGAKWENEKNNIYITHLQNCLKQPIAYIGNVEYQKGYRQATEDFINSLEQNNYE
jgi:hypothetical protein